MADTIAHVKTDRLRGSLHDGRTKALDVILLGTLAEEKAETVFNTLANVQAEALVNILADTLEEEKVESSRAGLHTSREPKTVDDTLGDVEAKELREERWRPRHSATY